MIICCHTEFTKPWNSDELLENISQLPLALQVKILRKGGPKNIQLSVCGKLLLMQVLTAFGLDLSLDDMEYDAYHRPYFNADFDFNISHSGNRVICCGTTTAKVGADIEQVKPINFNDYTDYFTNNEWDNILNARDPNAAFYKFWTRQEAVLKAAGTGFYIPLQEIDVSAENVPYNNYIYHLSEVKLDGGYQCHIAATVEQDIDLIQVKL